MRYLLVSIVLMLLVPTLVLASGSYVGECQQEAKYGAEVSAIQLALTTVSQVCGNNQLAHLCCTNSPVEALDGFIELGDDPNPTSFAFYVSRLKPDLILPPPYQPPQS